MRLKELTGINGLLRNRRFRDLRRRYKRTVTTCRVGLDDVNVMHCYDLRHLGFGFDVKRGLMEGAAGREKAR